MTASHWEGPEFLWGEDRARLPPGSSTPRVPVDGVPGEVGLWVFILGDMTIFGAFFTVFMWENREHRATFAAASRDLYQPIGAVNTLILLLASFLVVLALQAHRDDRGPAVRRFILGAALCALAFAALKATEYALELHAHHTPASNDFFTLYFVLTGIHLLHVLIGSVLLALWWRRAGRGWPGERSFVECAAAYWHMVDLLWIAIFTFFYLTPVT